jgi:hypothetical protein
MTPPAIATSGVPSAAAKSRPVWVVAHSELLAPKVALIV